VVARRLVLVRHAESEWNATGRWQGHGGVGLSPRGRSQARTLARFVAAHEPEICLLAASDLQRVIETLEPTARLLGFRPLFDARLRELDVGWWSGLTNAQIAERDPRGHAAYRSGADVRRGGAETETQLRARVTAAVDDLVQRCADGTLLIFTHGGPIRTLVAAALHLPVAQTRGLMAPGNCSRTVLQLQPGATRLLVYNETAFLEPPD
jgi:glucosyl-3-phosphoglycerate phosphatase